jgi:hypothetical protein
VVGLRFGCARGLHQGKYPPSPAVTPCRRGDLHSYSTGPQGLVIGPDLSLRPLDLQLRLVDQHFQPLCAVAPSSRCAASQLPCASGCFRSQSEGCGPLPCCSPASSTPAARSTSSSYPPRNATWAFELAMGRLFSAVTSDHGMLPKLVGPGHRRRASPAEREGDHAGVAEGNPKGHVALRRCARSNIEARIYL